MIELVLRLGLSLGIVLGLFWAIARTGSKRMGGSRSLLKVRSRQSLSRSSSVAVVEVGSRVLVVGVSDGGVRLLTELDPQELGETAAADAVAAAAPGRRAALAPRGLRVARAARTSGGKRRAGVPVATPSPVDVPALASEVTEPAPAPAHPASATARPAGPDFAAMLAAARAAQAAVEPVRPATPAPTRAPAPAPTLPDQLVAAMPAALVAIAEAELASARPAGTRVTQVAPASSAPVPALAAASSSGSPLAGSILAPGTWRSAWAAASAMASRTPRTAPQGRP
jgi:flagellar protein FliO/FliZ